MEILHIAGTNGKGQAALYIAQILKEAGISCGAFLSPHLIRETERIQVDGEEISQECLAQLMQKNQQGASCLFDAYTKTAMDYFEQKGVQVAVLETGLGGRLDPTTRYASKINILTRIGYDHMNYLGKTMMEIAKEKAAIINQNASVFTISQPQEAMEVITQAAEQKHAELIVVRGENIQEEGNGLIKIFDFILQGQQVQAQIAALTDVQVQNAVLAANAAYALNQFGFSISTEQVQRGLKNAVIPARQQIVMDDDVEVMIDGGHNEDAFGALEQTVRHRYAGQKPVFLIAMMKDKDPQKLYELIGGLQSEVVVTQVDEERGKNIIDMSEELLEREAHSLMVKEIAEAYFVAKKMAKNSRTSLVVCGSMYLAGEILKLLEKEGIYQS